MDGRTHSTGMFLFAAVLAGMLAPVALAEVLIHDVALGEGGVLQGRVLDRLGSPLPHSEVILLRGETEVGRTVAAADGRFQFAGLRGGVHQLVAHEDVTLCRLWTASAAPPAAKAGLALYGDSELVRGQCGSCQPARVSCRRPCGPCGPCTTPSYGTMPGYEGAAARPVVPVEELRELAPDLPAEQFAALTRADVVIANPQHISVAIAYQQGVPTVVAKGGDELALQIQRVANRGGIPVVRRPELARALFERVEVGQPVPPDLLGEVTDILASLSAPAPSSPPVGPRPLLPRGVSTRNLLIGGAVIGTAIALPIALSKDDIVGPVSPPGGEG